MKKMETVWGRLQWTVHRWCVEVNLLIVLVSRFVEAKQIQNPITQRAQRSTKLHEGFACSTPSCNFVDPLRNFV